MSKTISLLNAGAPAALFKSAASIVSKATGGAVRTPEATSAEAHTVVVGMEAPRGVCACAVQPPSTAHAAYAGVKTVVVRAILPRGAPGTLQVRDAIDVFPSSGIPCDAEVEAATASYVKAAEVAAGRAKEARAGRVTLVIKPATKYQRLNDLFLRTCTRVLEEAGLTVEVTHTAEVSNTLVMFPEKLGVVLTNDDPVSEHIQWAFAGVTGGAHVTYHTASGLTLSGGHSYKTVAHALATELKGLGMKAEAAKIEAAAEKDPLHLASAL